METRAEIVGVLHLVEITTLDGPFRFMLGLDGEFIDSSGQRWLGSTILSASERAMMIGDEAPRGSLSMTFIQDPSMADVVTQIKDLGVDYVYGLPVKFWVQPFTSHEEIMAPTSPPRLMLTRKATGITFDIDGPARRTITLAYEGIGANGNHQLRRVYNTADHARLIGRQNPSLQYIPQAAENDVPLFG